MTLILLGIILICNSLILGIALYYACSLLFSYITFSQVAKPSQFIFKLFLASIAVNFSLFFTKQIVYLFSIISLAIREIGESLFNNSISLSSLIKNINLSIYASEISLNIFSVDGIIKSFLSIGLINLAISYSLRYIMIKVFIILSPFAFLSLIIPNTTWIFKSWIKMFCSMLSLQILVPIILLITFSIGNNLDNFSKLIYIGSIFALIKANTFVKEFMGGLSTDANLGFSTQFLSRR